MFARVITVEAGPEGLDSLIDAARRQLPGARLRPGFRAFYLLTDAETGKLVTLSFWDSREQRDDVAQDSPAGIHDEGTESAASMMLETYEVTLHA